jgi:diacylglycerol kinase family enzyme
MKEIISINGIKSKLSLSKPITQINTKLLKKLWQKDKKIIDVSGATIFVNTLSRGHFSMFRRHILKKFVEKNNLNIQYVTTIDQITSSDIAKKSKIIFIASGDGFFDGVLGNSFFNNKSLGFFPLGVGNAVFPFFYKKKIYCSLLKKIKFYQSEIDIIQIKLNDKNLETLGTSIGLDAEFMKHHPQRTKLGWVDYIKGGILTFALAKNNYKLTISVDNKKQKITKIVNITLGKLPYYGFKVRCLPYRVNPSNGLIYSVVCKSIFRTHINKILRAISFLSILFNLYNPVLKNIHGEKFIIKSNSVFPIQSGGEFLGYFKKAEITVKRKQKFLTT